MAKNMSLQDFNKMLQPIAAEKGIPLFGGFELTPRCNLSCKMCYVKCKGAGSKYAKDELTTKQWIALGREAAVNGTLIIFLTGGEPLLREDFREIYECYCRLGFRLNLFTNGTLITEEFAKWISQIPPSTVDVTLYGANEQTYFNLCGQKEAFNNAINGIELLLKYNINTRLKTTIVRTNACDYKDIKAISKAYGIEFVVSNLIHGNRTTGIMNIEEERLSPKEVCNFNCDDMDIYDGKKIDLKGLKDKYKNIPSMFCTAGKGSFFINWRGELVPCPLFETPYTEPLILGYKKAWDNLREDIKKIPNVNECMSCDLRAFCPICPPRLYLETGKFDGHSDYICKLAEEREKLCRCKGTGS